jgi:5-carboxymethyl-2-hydroxymuconic-semialdehyde dehydrogenase
MPSAVVAGVSVSTDHWIGGRRVSSAETFEDVSPIDGAVIAHVARGGAVEAAAAVKAAQQAFPAWAATSRQERARVLHAIADGVEKRIEELALVETTDNGALIRSHRRGVMPRVAHNFRFFADYLLGLEHDDFDTRGHRNHVSWDPAGPTVLITPWNAPLMLASWKVAPTLAAGKTAVLKPAEWTPLTASLLCDIAAVAGLPDGVLIVVLGYGE